MLRIKNFNTSACFVQPLPAPANVMARCRFKTTDRHPRVSLEVTESPPDGALGGSFCALIHLPSAHAEGMHGLLMSKWRIRHLWAFLSHSLDRSSKWCYLALNPWKRPSVWYFPFAFGMRDCVGQNQPFAGHPNTANGAVPDHHPPPKKTKHTRNKWELPSPKVILLM